MSISSGWPRSMPRRSGILSIAAAKLGADTVTAVDTDREAVANASENVALNGVAERVEVLHGSARDVPGRFDVVVANIIRSALVPILPDAAARLEIDGRVLLGGILGREAAGFRRDATDAGLCVGEESADGEWVAFVATLAGH